MGACISSQSLHLPTATLVVFQEDAGGLIKEFKEPVKVGEILRERPGFFLCDADSMRYDEYVAPLSADQELQMEHLYFLLPLNKLRHPLLASDMAALAVETNAAMERNRHCRNKLGQRCCKMLPSLLEQEVAGVNNHKIITSSSSSGRGETKGEGCDSEPSECQKNVEVGLSARSVYYKLQRVASSARKSVNGISLRRNLSTIYEESFHMKSDNAK